MRMSAQFVGKKVGLSTASVYKMWSDMDLIKKNKFGNWSITDLGRVNGGKMSNSKNPVPTFNFDVIELMMIDFYNSKQRR